MSTVSLILTALITATNFVTGATYEAPTCPPQTQWQWHTEHGIWACGGQR